MLKAAEPTQRLIVLKDNLIVHPSEIRHASRMGNTTYVALQGQEIALQIWDEDESVWKAIQRAAGSK
jgi:hypothetical protein